MPDRQISSIIKATLAVTAWGVTFVATKVALRYVSPATVVWLRFSIGLAVLGAALGFRRQWVWPSGGDFGYFAGLGFLGITFHQWLQSTGMVTSQAATTAWIVATTPIFMALLGWIVLKEKVHWLQIVGIAAAAMGVVLVVTKGELPSLALGRFGAPGDILILLSAPNWAIFSALSRRGLRKFPATLMIFYVMLFGWLFSTLLFLWGHGPAQLVNLNLDGWLAIIFLGVFGSGLAYIFWYDALQTLPIAQTGAFVYLEPFVTVIVAALFLSEAIGWASMVGGIGILLGIWLVNRPGSRRRPTGLSSG